MEIKKFFESFNPSTEDYSDYILTFVENYNKEEVIIQKEVIRKNYYYCVLRLNYELEEEFKKYISESKRFDNDIVKLDDEPTPFWIDYIVLIAKKPFWDKAVKLEDLKFRKHHLVETHYHYKDEFMSIVSGDGPITNGWKYEVMFKGDDPVRLDSDVELQFLIWEDRFLKGVE
jgi:mannose-6-phosphate isomerase-like protein (cupin superfamily)